LRMSVSLWLSVPFDDFFARTRPGRNSRVGCLPVCRKACGPGSQSMQTDPDAWSLSANQGLPSNGLLRHRVGRRMCRVGVGQVFEAVFLGTDYVMTYLPR
jgi:hypothetical protein